MSAAKPGTHRHDPATYEPLDAELCDDDESSDAEREAMLHDECVGNYPDWQR